MRFTLWGLLLFISVFGIYLGLAFATPAMVSILGLTLVTYVLGPVVVTGIVYDRGYGRTFWIGCASAGVLPYLIALYHGATVLALAFSGWSNLGDVTGGEWRTWAIAVVLCHSIVFLAGFVAAFTRWVIEKKNRRIDQQRPGVAAQPTPPSVLSKRVSVEMEPVE